MGTVAAASSSLFSHTSSASQSEQDASEKFTINKDKNGVHQPAIDAALATMQMANPTKPHDPSNPSSLSGLKPAASPDSTKENAMNQIVKKFPKLTVTIPENTSNQISPPKLLNDINTPVDSPDPAEGEHKKNLKGEKFRDLKVKVQTKDSRTFDPKMKPDNIGDRLRQKAEAEDLQRLKKQRGTLPHTSL